MTIDYVKLGSRCVVPNLDANNNILSWIITHEQNTIELSEADLIAREATIINCINLGYYLPINFTAIMSSFNNHTAVIKVMSDALMIGESDSFIRINMSMTGERKIAQILGMSLLTPKVADLIYANASVKIEPCTQIPDVCMAHTSRMIKHSNDINVKITSRINSQDLTQIGLNQLGIVADVGKDWVLSNKIKNETTAANYGWRTTAKPNPNYPGNGPFSGPDGYMWQPLGTAHNTEHVDYSQVVRLMLREIMVDGQLMDFKDVVTSTEYCGLVNYDGILTVTE